jgi:hypothetical protein
VNPIEALARQPDGAEIAMSLAAQLTRLSPAELSYKGLAAEKARLVEQLDRIARG